MNRQKWEYRVRTSFDSDRLEGFGGPAIQDALDSMGEDGWELVTVHNLMEQGKGLKFFFRRPKD